MKVSIITLQFFFVVFFQCWEFPAACVTSCPKPPRPPKPSTYPTRPPPLPPLPPLPTEFPDYSTTDDSEPTSETYPDLSTPPWNSDIPPVINPNYVDKPPWFTATIITATGETPLCSAAIISLHFLISSCSRCLTDQHGKPIPQSNISILISALGEDDYMNQNGMSFDEYKVDRVANHPHCLYMDHYNLKHDIGVIKTAAEIEFKKFVGAAKIPANDGTFHPSIHENLILSAFRPKNTAAYTFEETVWFVKVRNLKSTLCRKVLNSSFYDPAFTFCTSYYHSGRTDGCLDDFGASLSFHDYLVGILIHKFSCGRSGSVGSFVSVIYNREWIQEVVQTLSDNVENI
ncbi:hypothetical protein ILUMI_19920 [Ignelater luminosus]|uniref:Peptidase S1 domain-containing protein n=1 Tax=Ignelater luminosus TaxID=2038154 RepID=A0A8K0CF91_IGNLU|nr:hypothetical protein ILUMI_19920 [Ignelater luminosus]